MNYKIHSTTDHLYKPYFNGNSNMLTFYSENPYIYFDEYDFHFENEQGIDVTNTAFTYSVCDKRNGSITFMIWNRLNASSQKTYKAIFTYHNEKVEVDVTQYYQTGDITAATVTGADKYTHNFHSSVSKNVEYLGEVIQCPDWIKFYDDGQVSGSDRHYAHFYFEKNESPYPRAGQLIVKGSDGNGDDYNIVDFVQYGFAVIPAWLDYEVNNQYDGNYWLRDRVENTINFDEYPLYEGQAWQYPYVSLNRLMITDKLRDKLYLNSNPFAREITREDNAMMEVGLFYNESGLTLSTPTEVQVTRQTAMDVILFNNYSYDLEKWYTNGRYLLQDKVEDGFPVNGYFIATAVNFDVLNQYNWDVELFVGKQVDGQMEGKVLLTSKEYNQNNKQFRPMTICKKLDDTTVGEHIYLHFTKDDRYVEIGTVGDGCADYQIVYQNSVGGWDSFVPRGKSHIYQDVTRDQYTSMVNNATYLHNDVIYNVNSKRKWEINTGIIEEWQVGKLSQNLINSPVVYLIDLRTDEIIPVTITNKQSDLKYTTKKVKTIQLTLEESRERER